MTVWHASLTKMQHSVTIVCTASSHWEKKISAIVQTMDISTESDLSKNWQPKARAYKINTKQ